MNIKIITFIFFLIISSNTYSQIDKLNGDFKEHRSGLHSGNQFRTSFFNDGQWGNNSQDPTSISGEWPINSGNAYLLDGTPRVGSEVIDINNEIKRIFSEAIGPFTTSPVASGERGPDGSWYTFLPLPGFANSDTNKIAMVKGKSIWANSWPSFWPDKTDDPIDPGWRGAWNGYFGKDQFNADEESYYVADDYHNREFSFYPDSNNLDRRGLGMRMYVRGLQWSNPLVEDGIFTLFDIQNIGTYKHNKVVFGFKVGNQMGGKITVFGDGTDDNGSFDRDQSLAYLWDNDGIGVAGQTNIGYFGGAFLESPGNPFDGIDNDNDAEGIGSVISEDMFLPRTLKTGDQIIVIDYENYNREIITLQNDTIAIQFLDRVYKFYPGKTVKEEPHNLFDDDLNGLIDENNGAAIGNPDNPIIRYLYVGYSYKNYLTGENLENLLIDEKRDDGIDNDGDWNILTDDVGLDGKPFTGDFGEGDGLPTSGAGTNFPGEPNIDKTDIDETDMLGLTSFLLSDDYNFSDDEKTWSQTKPGVLNDVRQNSPTDLLYSSGYFPMSPKQIERFSMGLICGDNLNDLYQNKYWFDFAYAANYQFAKAPDLPTVKAIPGDNKVTLVWDKVAEFSDDPVLGRDFEGYRIYRSTDPAFSEMIPITDGRGSVTFREPMVQFDLINEFEGFAPVPIKGVQYYLGDNTGIVHEWTDSTAVNGYTYYYAVTAYDHGSLEKLIPPSETSRFISVNSSGEIDKGSNVVIVKPEAPSIGFIPAVGDEIAKAYTSTTDGFITTRVIFPQDIKDQNTYRMVFSDTLTGVRKIPTIKDFSLINITTGDTLVNKSTNISETFEQPIVQGFTFNFNKIYNELAIDEVLTRWNSSEIYNPLIESYTLYARGNYKLQVSDFKISFGEVGIDTSTYFERQTEILSAIPVNFSITNNTLNKKVKFAFRERDVETGKEGIFSAYSGGLNRRDEIILLNEDNTAGWQVMLAPSTETKRIPESGDTLYLVMNKPFLSQDSLEFTMLGESVNNEIAKNELNKIRVVPNPYIVANTWEAVNQYTTGRGEREIHFIHLPPKCKIRIFNISGQLVDEIDHDKFSDRSSSDGLWNGTAVWDMKTKDNLDISYGIYIYHVQADGVGDFTGKFAVIK